MRLKIHVKGGAMMSPARCRKWGLVYQGQGIFLHPFLSGLYTLLKQKDEKENLASECTGVAGKFIGVSIIPLTFSNKLPASKNG